MYCLHSFTLCPDPWVFERAGVFTPGLLEDWSVFWVRGGCAGPHSRRCRGPGSLSLSHRGCTSLEARLPPEAPAFRCLGLMFSQWRGAGDLTRIQSLFLFSEKKGRDMGDRAGMRSLSMSCLLSIWGFPMTCPCLQRF